MKRHIVVAAACVLAACQGMDLTKGTALQLLKKSPRYTQPLTVDVAKEYEVSITDKKAPQKALDEFLKGKSGQLLMALAELKYVKWDSARSFRDNPFNVFVHEKQDVWVITVSLLAAGARVAVAPRPHTVAVPGQSEGEWAFPIATQEPYEVLVISTHPSDKNAAAIELKVKYRATPLGAALEGRGTPIPNQDVTRHADARRFDDGWRLDGQPTP